MPNIGELSGFWWLAAFGTVAFLGVVSATLLSRKIEKEGKRELEIAKRRRTEAEKILVWARSGVYFEPSMNEVETVIAVYERQAKEWV